MSKTNITFILIMLVVIVGAGYFIGKSAGLFSIITPATSVNLNNGKVYWLTTLNVDSPAETNSFQYRIGNNVNNVPLNDGTGRIVQPKTSFDITMSMGANKCLYSLAPSTLYDIGFGWQNLNGYKQSSLPTRQIWYSVTSGKTGESKTINSVAGESYEFKDDDGAGSVIVKSVTTGSGALYCPSADDIFVCKTNTGITVYLDYSAIIAATNDAYIIPPLTTDACEYIRTQRTQFVITNFVTNFQSISNRDTSMEATMYPNALGTPIVTITADQDIFDSVIYTPPVIAEPNVDGFNCDLSSGQQSTMNVQISNKNSNTGLITITPSGGLVSFSPQSQQATLTSSLTRNFIVNSPSVSTNTQTNICVEACGQGNQFETGKCDSLCRTCTIEVNNPSECGIHGCQPEIGETYTTCPADCPHITDCTTIPNSYLDQASNTCLCNDGFIMSFEDGQYVCNPKASLPVLSIIIALLGLGFFGFGIYYKKEDETISKTAVYFGLLVFCIGLLWLVLAQFGLI